MPRSFLEPFLPGGRLRAEQSLDYKARWLDARKTKRYEADLRADRPGVAGKGGVGRGRARARVYSLFSDPLSPTLCV